MPCSVLNSALRIATIPHWTVPNMRQPRRCTPGFLADDDTSVSDVAAPGDEVKKRHEQCGADDRPHDRKRLAAHMEHERFGKVELMRNPRSEERADKSKGDGSDEPAPS